MEAHGDLEPLDPTASCSFHAALGDATTAAAGKKIHRSSTTSTIPASKSPAVFDGRLRRPGLRSNRISTQTTNRGKPSTAANKWEDVFRPWSNWSKVRVVRIGESIR